MIKDVMVWLDGSLSDDIRLAAVADIARRFESQVIGLFLNPLPLPGPVDGDVAGTLTTAERMDRAREAGNKTEALLAKRLKQLERPVEIRRFDVLTDDMANVAAREARFADTFVALRPNGAMDPERLVEGVLFGSGRPLPRSKGGPTKDRLRPHPCRLEWQSGVRPGAGRRHANSI